MQTKEGRKLTERKHINENCRKQDKWHVNDISKTETFASESNPSESATRPPRPLSQPHPHTLKCKCLKRKEVIFIHSLGGHGRGVRGYTPFHRSILYAPLCLRQPGARREATGFSGWRGATKGIQSQKGEVTGVLMRSRI